MQTSKPNQSDPSLIQTVMNCELGLKALMKKSKQLQSANTTLAQILPEDLKRHCLCANVRYGIITLSADSAIWITPLRYYQHTLLKALQAIDEFKHIRSIHYRVHAQKIKKEKKVRTLDMSGSVSQVIETCAKSVKSTVLKDALLKLSSNGNK